MRKTGFTIAPEAGSARLRAVVSKNVSDEEILDTSSIVFRNGWDLIKLYFMFGLRPRPSRISARWPTSSKPSAARA